MTCRLFTAASLISLLVCVTAVVLWRRSDDHRDEIRWPYLLGAKYAFVSDRGE